MKKLSPLLKKIDDNLVKILFSMFIFIVPLYPKLPIRMINYTYIAVRAEDFFMVFLSLVFAIQFIRKKVSLDFKLFLFLFLFLLFWVSCFASVFYGLSIRTIIINHLGYLHALRRIEYMFVFFIGASLVTSKKEFFYYLRLILVVFLIVSVYGIGQKFLGWPAVQTMNPEYAKGYLLFLTPEARVSSTFAGHYDLAAYLIFLMPILLGYFFFRSQIRYFVWFCISLFTLILTASRISYGAYIISVFLFLLTFKKFKYFLIVFVLTALLTASSKNLTSRIERTFQVKQIFVNQQTGQVIVPQKITTKEIPAGTFFIELKPKGTGTAKTIPSETEISTTDAGLTSKQLTTSKTQGGTGKIVSKPKKILNPMETIIASVAASLNSVKTTLVNFLFPSQIYTKSSADEQLMKQKIKEDIRWEASRSGTILTAEDEDRMIASIAAGLKPITTVVSDISFATRIQVEWPRAIMAFIKSPILGTGPSSITEATDNDFLRWLGELGLLGTTLFLGILGLVAKNILSYTLKLKGEIRLVYFGFLFGLGALLFNATYIDVFEASKLAFQFWITSGIFIGSTKFIVKLK